MMMRLSTRQIEILTLIADGHRDKQIAQHLGLSVRTVDSHLQRLYDRYGVRSRAGIVARWLLEGDMTPGGLLERGTPVGSADRG
jgi:DNA-binding CsgD family transcriptional regulator